MYNKWTRDFLARVVGDHYDRDAAGVLVNIDRALPGQGGFYHVAERGDLMFVRRGTRECVVQPDGSVKQTLAGAAEARVEAREHGRSMERVPTVGETL